MIFEMLTAGVLTAGSGRGFVVEGAGERLVITSAHCLPLLPPAQSFFGPKERTYGPLLARLEDEPRAWAVCRFVDPIADIAVLGSPDNPRADEYKALTATALSIGGSLRNPVNFWVPARLLSADGLDEVPVPAGMPGGPPAGLVDLTLDVALPDADGFEVLRRIRAESKAPVLMLATRAGDVERLVGLELGADVAERDAVGPHDRDVHQVRLSAACRRGPDQVPGRLGVALAAARAVHNGRDPAGRGLDPRAGQLTAA